MKAKLLLYILLVALGHSLAILFACSTAEEPCSHRTQTSINCEIVDREFVERIRFYQEECFSVSILPDAKFLIYVKPDSFLVNRRDSISLANIMTVAELQETLASFCAVVY